MTNLKPEIKTARDETIITLFSFGYSINGISAELKKRGLPASSTTTIRKVLSNAGITKYRKNIPHQPKTSIKTKKKNNNDGFHLQTSKTELFRVFYYLLTGKTIRDKKNDIIAKLILLLRTEMQS